jgi:glucokinase
MSERLLVGDIGGTNSRFAIAGGGRIITGMTVPTPGSSQGFRDAIAKFLAAIPVEQRPSKAVFAVAGPVAGDVIVLTNQNWSVSTKELAESLGLTHLDVINDFAAVSFAVPHLASDEYAQIGGGVAEPDGPIGVIGPGTGLGMSSIVRHRGRWIHLPGEGGHATMPAVTDEEADVLRVMRRRWQHVSAERALSGPGLVNLYQALCALGGREPAALGAAEIGAAASAGTDELCVRAFAMFCAMLGTVAGDLALTIGATGGVYIAGGILRRYRAELAASGFRSRFEQKGRLSTYLRPIPTFLILHEAPTLHGLARLRVAES